MSGKLAQPSARQLQVFDFVRGYLVDHARSPSLREIAAHIGSTSPNGAMYHIRALERWRLIRTLRTSPTRQPVYAPAFAEPLALPGLEGTVRVGVTGPVVMTRAKWRAWLTARLAELGDAA